MTMRSTGPHQRLSPRPLDDRHAREVLKRIVAVVAVTAGSLAAASSCTRAGLPVQAVGVGDSVAGTQDNLLIRGGTVIDVHTLRAASRSDVQIRDGRIICVGRAGRCRPSRGTPVLDARGKWLLPGLIDAHVHVTIGDARANLRALLGAGVTAARDVGAFGDSAEYAVGAGQVERILALARWAEQPDADAPRLFFCGPGFGSTRGQTVSRPGSHVILLGASDTAARHYVAYLVAKGASCVKAFSGASEAHIRALGAAAGAERVPLIGHTRWQSPLGPQLAWGLSEVHHAWFDAVELLSLMDTARLPKPVFARLFVGWSMFEGSTPESAALARRVAGNSVSWVPTLHATQSYPLGFLWPAISYAADSADHAQIAAALFQGRMPRSTADSSDALTRASYSFSSKWTGILHRAGVPIIAGSDAPAEGAVAFGAGLHEELEALVRAGLSHGDAIRAATIVAARALGADHMIGSIESGKAGDIIIVDGNPLSDVRHARAIWKIVRGGAVSDPQR